MFEFSRSVGAAIVLVEGTSSSLQAYYESGDATADKIFYSDVQRRGGKRKRVSKPHHKKLYSVRLSVRPSQLPTTAPATSLDPLTSPNNFSPDSTWCRGGNH